jgi:hypothetical protein
MLESQEQRQEDNNNMCIHLDHYICASILISSSDLSPNAISNEVHRILLIRACSKWGILDPFLRSSFGRVLNLVQTPISILTFFKNSNVVLIKSTKFLKQSSLLCSVNVNKIEWKKKGKITLYPSVFNLFFNLASKVKKNK